MPQSDEQLAQKNTLKKQKCAFQFFTLFSILVSSALFLNGVSKLLDDRVKSTGPAIVHHAKRISFLWLNSQELTTHMIQGDKILCLEQLVMPLLCVLIIVFNIRSLLASSTYPTIRTEKHYP